MKTIFITVFALMVSLSSQSQNKNVTEVTKTTTTTIKDSDGKKQQVKKEKVKEVQNIELQNSESTMLNKDLKQTPIQVTSTTQITNPDGTTRTVDVDRSSYYESNGKKYKIDLDASGYKILSPENAQAAILRKTSINSYIFVTKDKTAVGYFDTNGNLILETYDDKTDSIITEKYIVIKQ